MIQPLQVASNLHNSTNEKKLIMKNILKLAPVVALFIVNACSFANKSTVTVPINSNPPGATVMIDGRNYGQTPAFVELKPSKNYLATISKRGYGSVNVNMETWYSVRDGQGADGGRCMMDLPVLGIPYFIVLLFAPEKCSSFKQSDYFVDLAGGKQIMPEDLEPQANNQNQQNQYDQSNNGQSNNGYYGSQSPYQSQYRGQQRSSY